MLTTLMKFGEHRVDRFFQPEQTGKEFGFYVCADLKEPGGYCKEAKHQLYFGLAVIHSQGELKNLAGIYIDINHPENLLRPAYVALKQDLLEGNFHRVVMFQNSILCSHGEAKKDLAGLGLQIRNLELFTFAPGKFEIVPFSHH